MTRSKRPRWLSSTALIFYALILGVACGWIFPAETHPNAYETFRFLSKAFISLIKMLIVPLIFSTIVVGIGKTGDVKAVGRMGVKALIYFEVATTVALVLGLDDRARRSARRGTHAAAVGRDARASRRRWSRRCCTSSRRTSSTRWPSRTSSRSSSSRRSSASPPRTSRRKSGPFLHVMDSVVAVMFQLTDYVMALTPLGVFGAMAGSVSHHGMAVLASYAKLVGVALRRARALRARSSSSRRS